ncbi:hypothetical protein D9615_009670 [Tricholomella constricta]|uniref:Uncharacterized protein n=1 Tax=Tricholomella constricta TaxID=117010 RepID=A0A8H5LVT1_9AGAR|nr:hypothetical protein D9615_009670 [Tricholomella constricta]
MDKQRHYFTGEKRDGKKTAGSFRNPLLGAWPPHGNRLLEPQSLSTMYKIKRDNHRAIYQKTATDTMSSLSEGAKAMMVARLSKVTSNLIAVNPVEPKVYLRNRLSNKQYGGLTKFMSLPMDVFLKVSRPCKPHHTYDHHFK